MTGPGSNLWDGLDKLVYSMQTFHLLFRARQSNKIYFFGFMAVQCVKLLNKNNLYVYFLIVFSIVALLTLFYVIIRKKLTMCVLNYKSIDIYTQTLPLVN